MQYPLRSLLRWQHCSTVKVVLITPLANQFARRANFAFQGGPDTVWVLVRFETQYNSIEIGVAQPAENVVYIVQTILIKKCFVNDEHDLKADLSFGVCIQQTRSLSSKLHCLLEGVLGSFLQLECMLSAMLVSSTMPVRPLGPLSQTIPLGLTELNQTICH